MQDKVALEKMRAYFDSGSTKSYSFRKTQLEKLKKSILRHEKEMYEALNADLKKNPEEAWITEIGMVLNELKTAILKLRKWMMPEKVGTNLLNFPSGSRILKEPFGVVLIIGPWNYPFQLLINPFVGALAAGNCVVLKPSEFAPATAAIMKKIVEDIFPPEYVLYVEGDGGEVIPNLMKDFRFDHVFFTGSTAIGRLIYKMAADKLVPVTLELGGKSPCIVESDANIKVASRRIAITKFSNAGQMCVAPDYVLVHESRKDELITGIKLSLEKFFGEDASKSYSYGKIINEKQFDRICEYMNQGKLVYGGQTNREKLFISPTIITDVPADASVMKDEIFGPVLPIITFNSAEEAQEIIQRNPDPLSFYLYTSSPTKEQYWLEAVPAGGACVNNSSWHLTNHHLPFGGRGTSGFGKYHGKYSFETFSHHKAVMKTPTWFDPDFKYPPFEGKLKWYKKI